MLIHASRRIATDTLADAVHWTVETDNYEAGMEQVRGEIPEGWVLLSVRVDR